MPEQLVEGWTEPIDQRLLAENAPFDGTGMTVGLQLLDKDGTPVDTEGKVTWLVVEEGVARYLPDAGDLLALQSPYTARWRVTAAGRDAFFPNGYADQWIVRP
jgi:hypothetical protein